MCYLLLADISVNHKLPYLHQIVFILEQSLARDAVGVAKSVTTMLVERFLTRKRPIADRTIPVTLFIRIPMSRTVVNVLLPGCVGIEPAIALVAIRHLDHGQDSNAITESMGSKRLWSWTGVESIKGSKR
jgi:hypothetical protein